MLSNHAPVGAPTMRCRQLYLPPCAPSSTSARPLRLCVRASSSKENQDDKIKREQTKADYSALWAQRVKNFMSGRRKYLQQAEAGVEDEEAKAFKREIELDEERLDKQKQELVMERQAKMQELFGPDASAAGQAMLETDMERAALQLQTSPLTKAALAIVRVRELLKALLMLPFTIIGAVWRGWRQLFESPRYEKFLMSEGERIWFWRNRMENERWFWEVFLWDRLLFPVISIASYEWLVPNHFFWALVVPYVLWSWLSGKIITPRAPEFWLLTYFGFYRKCWPDVSAWLTNVVLSW